MPAWVVTQEESGQKLSGYLKAKLGAGYSIRRIKENVEHNACLINGRVERFASTPVGKGDRVDFREVCLGGEALPAVRLYEDRAFIAISKPAGVSSEDPNLAPAADAILLHRLDKDTTGVLLYATIPAAAKGVLELFRKREVAKHYLALVDGLPQRRSGYIENKIGKIRQYQGQSLWGERNDGVRAITEWTLEKQFGSAALLCCTPLTGRTHQIRVHLSGIGHPILGDRQYGKKFVCPLRPARCMLHASRLEFLHPLTGERVEIVASLPEDFQEAMKVVGDM